MDVLGYLIPASLFLGGLGLVAFLWSLRSDQYEDPEGDSRRILTGEYDDRPKEAVESHPEESVAPDSDASTEDDGHGARPSGQGTSGPV